MYDKLKTFITENKEEFDSLEPSKNIWTKIDNHMNITQTLPVKSKWLSWLKYVGLSAPVVLSIAYFSYKNTEIKIDNALPLVGTEQAKTIVTESNLNNSIESNNNSANLAATIDSEANKQLTESTQNKTVITKNATEIIPIIPTTNPINNTNEQQTITYSNQTTNTTPKLIVQGNKPVNRTKKSGKGETNILIDTLFLGVKKLEIDASFFNINLKSNQTDKVLFHGEMHTELRGLFISKMDCKIKYEQKDSVLHVYIETKKGNASVGFGSVKQEAFLNFDVPPTTDVVVNSNSGDINIDGLKGKICNVNANYGNVGIINTNADIIVHNNSGNVGMDGLKSKKCDVNAKYGNVGIINTNSDLTLECTSGNISLSNIKGAIKAHSSYGNQLLENIEGGIDLKNNSGDVHINHSKGDIKLESKYGDQHLEDIIGKIVSKNNSGEITIKKSTGDVTSFLSYGDSKFENIEGNILVKSSSGEINIKTLLGDMDIDATYGDVNTVDSKGNLLIVSKSGDITGKNIEIKDKADFSATYGNIKMKFKNEFNDLSFDLKANSGDLKVDKNGQKLGGENGKLFLNKGKILVKGYTASGDQHYE